MAYFFVGVKADPDRPVGDGFVAQQPRSCRHDDGYPGFVVGTEQSQARRGYQVFAYCGEDVGVHRIARINHLARVIRQYNGPTVVVGMHDRLDVFAAIIRRRIDMREERHDRLVLEPRGRGDGRHDVAVFGNDHILRAQFGQLGLEQAQQIPLALGRWVGFGIRVAGGIDFDIAQKSLAELVWHSLSLFRSYNAVIILAAPPKVGLYNGATPQTRGSACIALYHSRDIPPASFFGFLLPCSLRLVVATSMPATKKRCSPPRCACGTPSVPCSTPVWWPNAPSSASTGPCSP